MIFQERHHLQLYQSSLEEAILQIFGQDKLENITDKELCPGTESVKTKIKSLRSLVTTFQHNNNTLLAHIQIEFVCPISYTYPNTILLKNISQYTSMNGAYHIQIL